MGWRVALTDEAETDLGSLVTLDHEIELPKYHSGYCNGVPRRLCAMES